MDGITGTGGSAGVLLRRGSLPPPGTVSLNGIKIFGDFSVEKVVGITATLIRDSGCGLEKIFHDLLRSQGRCTAGAGSSALRGGRRVRRHPGSESVLVGSASFMHLMEVTLPQG